MRDPDTHTIGPKLSMSQAELRRWDPLDYADALVREDGPRIAWYDSISADVASKTGQERTHGGTLFVPGDVLGTYQRRDLTSGVLSAGGATVATELGGFVQALYSAGLFGVLPCTRLDSLAANVTLGSESVKGSAGWVTEGGTLPDAQATYGQIALTPKTIGAKVTHSRVFGQQTGPAAKTLVMNGLAKGLRETFDTALLHGTGAGAQPLGLANTAGIDTRTGASLTWADAVAMLKVAEGYEQGENIVAVAGVTAAEVARKRERAAGSGFIAEGRTFAGAPMVVSRAASAATLSLMDWAGCWVGTWGALELQVDPFTDFKTGKVTIDARWLVDVAFERPSKIAYASAIS